MGETGIWGCLGPMTGQRPCPQDLGRGGAGQHSICQVPSPLHGPVKGMFIGVQQSTCQVLGIVLGTWGYTNVGDTSLGLNKLRLDGGKTDLQKVMMKRRLPPQSGAPVFPPTRAFLPGHALLLLTEVTSPGSHPRSPIWVRGSCLSFPPPPPDCVAGQQGWHRPLRPGTLGAKRAAEKGGKERRKDEHRPILRWQVHTDDPLVCDPPVGAPFYPHTTYPQEPIFALGHGLWEQWLESGFYGECLLAGVRGQLLLLVAGRRSCPYKTQITGGGGLLVTKLAGD